MNQQIGRMDMEGYKVVVLQMDVEGVLADRLVDQINSSVGNNIAVKCRGTPGTVLERANKRGIEQVVFYGLSELQNDSMTIKDMVQRQQYQIPKGELNNYFVLRYSGGDQNVK